jgi:DNA-binding CsgD family transcriptional regulator
LRVGSALIAKTQSLRKVYGLSTGRAGRSRGQKTEVGALLLERDRELATIDQALTAALRGEGRAIIIESPPGTGKSRLLAAVGDMALQAGMELLCATSSELELEFPFGVAIQLLEPLWTASDPNMRSALMNGRAQAAGELLEHGFFEEERSPGDHGYQLIHGLYWLASNLSSAGPLVILVDDAHWSDPPSLRFLSYLANRIDSLPIVLVAAVGQGEPVADRRELNALVSAPSSETLRPSALSRKGIESLVLSEMPDAEDAFVDACARVTHGNLCLLTELLAQLRSERRPPNAATARRLTDLAPETIVNMVGVRLGTMPAEAQALAFAVSVLGDRASLSHAARLAGLDEEGSARAADRLAAVQMLSPGAPLSFVHPLIRSAVSASMAPLARGQAHRRAALMLREDDYPAEGIAAHLLHAPAGNDQEAVNTLREAAHKALASGSGASSVRLFERALAEHPERDVRVDILAELGQAEASQGLPRAIERLTEAIRLADSPHRRAKLTLALSRELYMQGLHREAAEALDRELAQLDVDEPVALELEAAYISAASFVPSAAGDVWARRERLLRRLTDPPTLNQRSAVAHIALAASLRGEPRGKVVELADLAWGDGALLREETADGPNWPLLNAALLFADELERDIEMCDAALADARDPGSPMAIATASHSRSWALYEQGRIVEAAGCAAEALDARLDNSNAPMRSTHGALACCHLQRGELDQAESALATIDDPDVRESVRYPFLLDVRAKLRLAQHRPTEALADARSAGEALQSESLADCPGAIAWRSTAALAHLRLGETGRARELVEDELDRARRAGVTRVVIRDLCVLGLTQGAAGIASLANAVQTGERYPVRLEYVHALVELGAALRRANKRAAAREPLRTAIELSHRGGASALGERARAELAATGARPRRAMLSGVESLTPSERRVGNLAAQGLTTRQMAEALYVTPKTVEYHLRHTYRKLAISSRDQLSDVLAREAPA